MADAEGVPGTKPRVVAEGGGALAIHAETHSSVTVYQYITYEGGKVSSREAMDPSACPYPGLETFRTSEARYFAGREADIEALEAKLSEYDVCGVIAASGAGKSSLVHAGLIPALAARENEAWDVFAFKPGQEPLYGLARSLSGVLAEAKDLKGQLDEIDSTVEDLREKPGRLKRYVDGIISRRSNAADGKQQHVLIFVDQWEELYTRENEEDRVILIRELMDVADRRLAKILLTMRIDFMDELTSLSTDFFRALQPGIHYLVPMDENALRSAIEVPARKAGLGIPEALTSRLIAALDGGSAHRSLPYLQFVLRQLWEKRDHATNSLTTEAYRGMKGLEGAIGEHADAVFRKLTKEEQGLAQRVLPRLANVSEAGAITSRRLPFADFDEPARNLLRKLAEPERRLILLSSATAQVAEAEIVAEVAHEALLDEWKTLSGWIADRKSFFRLRNKLEADAKTWIKEGRIHDFLIPAGKPLLDAQDLLAQALEGEIEKYLDDFIGASTARDAERRKAEVDKRLRRRNRLLIVSIVTSAFLTFLTAWALLERQAAQDSAWAAQLSAALANTAEGERFIALGRNDQALEAVLKAFPNDLSEEQVAEIAFRAGSEPTLIESYMSTRLMKLVEIERGTSVGFVGALESELGFIGTAWNSIIEISPSRRSERLIPEAHGNYDPFNLAWDLGVFHLSLSPDEARLVSVGKDGVAKVWGVHDLKLEGQVKIDFKDYPYFQQAGYSPFGQYLWTLGEDKEGKREVTIYDSGNLVEKYRIRTQKSFDGDDIGSVHFAGSDKYVVTVTHGAFVEVWDATDGKQVAVLFSGNPADQGDAAWGLPFWSSISDEDREILVIPGRFARVYDSNTLAEIYEVEVIDEVAIPDANACDFGRIRTVAVAANGNRLVNIDSNGSIVLRELSSGEVISVSPVQAILGAAPVGVMISPDGSAVGAIFPDKSLLVLELGPELLLERNAVFESSLIHCAAYSPNSDVLVVRTTEGELVVADKLGRRELFRARSGVYAHSFLGFLGGGEFIATRGRGEGADSDGVYIWDAGIWGRKNLVGRDDLIMFAEGSIGSSVVLTVGHSRGRPPSGSPPNVAKLVDLSDGFEVELFRSSDDVLTTCVMSAVSGISAVGSAGGELVVHRGRGGRELKHRFDGEHAITMTFSQDASKLAILTSDARLWLWPLEEAEAPALVAEIGAVIPAATDSPTCGRGRWSPVSMSMGHDVSSEIVYIWIDGKLMTFDSSIGRISDWSEADVAQFEVSEDGNALLTVDEDGVGRVWHAASFELLAILSNEEGASRSYDLSPDGKWVAWIGVDVPASLAKVSDSGQVFRLMGEMSSNTGHDAQDLHPYDVQFSGDGSQLLVLDSGSDVRLWKVSDQTEVAALDHSGWVKDVAFSQSGDSVALLSIDEVEVFETRYGSLRARFEVSDGEGVFFSDEKNNLVVYGSGAVSWQVPPLFDLIEMGRSQFSSFRHPM